MSEKVVAEPAPKREPEIGDVLLFCVDDVEGRKRYRPFLACTVFDGDSVSGEVFPDYERDTKTKWSLRLFQGLRKENRTQWVSGALPGEDVGTWKFKEVPEGARAPRQKIVPLSKVQGGQR